MSTSLTVTITGQPGSSAKEAAPWLRLSQPELDGANGLATISGLVRMHNQALAGQPAQNALPTCPGLEELDDGRLQWSTEILVHRSRPDLPYTLGASNGDLGEPEHRTASHERSYTWPGADTIDLGILLAPGWRLEWETPAYDDTGRAMALPRIWSHGSALYADRPFFGVVRLFYDEVYQAWPLTITAQDQEDPFECVISAFWGDNQVEQHTVDVAACATEKAKSLCHTKATSSSSSGDDAPDEEEQEPRLHVEYDVCTGDVVRTYYA